MPYKQCNMMPSDTSAASAAILGLSERGCKDTQATLWSYRLSYPKPSANLVVSPNASGMREENQDYDSSSEESGSRRPSVQRTTSAPESSSTVPAMFVDAVGPSSARPSLGRSCSEALASGVLERRRRKASSSHGEILPSNLMLDLAGLPKTMGAGNVNLLRAARKALMEPREFDWGRMPASAPASAANSAFIDSRDRSVAPVRSTSADQSTLTTTTSEPARSSSRLPASRSCFARYWNRSASSSENEWEWAFAGNARATHEALRGSQYKETREPVHDIWQQLPDWVSRRSSLGGRDADLSLHGPTLCQSLTRPKAQVEQGPGLGGTVGSLSPRSSIAGRSRGHQAKASVHVPLRTVEEAAKDLTAGREAFAGAREHASDNRRSRSTERNSSLQASNL